LHIDFTVHGAESAVKPQFNQSVSQCMRYCHCSGGKNSPGKRTHRWIPERGSGLLQ